VKLINKLLVSLLVSFAVIGFASATPMDCQCPSCDCGTTHIVMKVGSSITISAKKWEKIEPKVVNSTFFNEHFNVTKNDKEVTITAIKAGHTEFDKKGKHGTCHVVLDIVE
jgi:hypothetical protein